MDLSTQTQTWTKKSVMQTPRFRLSVVQLGGKLYFIGGHLSTDLDVNTVETFDPSTNEWKVMKPMNQARSNACAVVHDNKIIVLGGYDEGRDWMQETLSSIEIYDPVSDDWTFGPSMSQPRLGLKAVVLNNVLYAMGGSLTETETKCVETLDLLNPNAVWSLATELVAPRRHFGATVADKKIMVAGGHDGLQKTRTTEFYSDETNQWITAQPMNEGSIHLSLLSIKGLPNRKKYITH